MCHLMSCSKSVNHEGKKAHTLGGEGTHTNLLPCLALKHSILWDAGYNKQLQILVSHGHIDKMFFLRKALAIEPCLLAHLPDGTYQIIFVLVDFSPGKTPARTLLPPFHEQALVHGEI